MEKHKRKKQLQGQRRTRFGTGKEWPKGNKHNEMSSATSWLTIYNRPATICESEILQNHRLGKKMFYHVVFSDIIEYLHTAGGKMNELMKLHRSTILNHHNTDKQK